jgi:2-keto-3-deoxy-L-rhamnonate aldolase
LEDYAAAGAQWGLVLAPGYFGKAVNQSNLIEWFTAVADRSPLPILMWVSSLTFHHAYTWI